MFKKITLLAIVSILFGLILSTLSLVEAKENTLSTSSSSILKVKTDEVKNNKITKLRPNEFKIVNGEIDSQPNIKMSKVEEENFGKCKSEEKQQRKPKYKNAPTACLKKPELVNDHITNQDYNLMWQAVNQQVEETSGADLKVELPISEFVEGNSSLSSTSTTSSTNTLTTQSNSNQVSVSSLSSAILNLSSQSSIKSDFSTNSKSISFLDILFGSVRVDAASNDGFRLPYENGKKATLTRGAYGAATHSDYTAFDFVGYATNNITSAKSGKVVYVGYTSNGFGNHIVVQNQSDSSTMIYAHLASYNVALNQNVNRGDLIGIEGYTGNVSPANATGQHLHFETWSRIPCNTSNYPEACYGNSYYKASAMLPKFDECTGNNNCTNGYPSTLQVTYTSQNSLPTTQNVLFRDVNSGANSIWKFSNTTHTGDTSFPNSVGPEWKVAGFGDFNGDGYKDIMWRNSNNGQNVIWLMRDGAVYQDLGIVSNVGTEFFVAGIGRF